MASPLQPLQNQIQRQPGYNREHLALAREMALPALAGIFDKGLRKFSEVLSNRVQMGGAIQQMMLMDNIRQLHSQHQTMLVRFGACLKQAWTGLETGRPLSAEALLTHAGQAQGGLSLMDETDLELLLMVRQFSEVVGHGQKQVLEHINRRLAHIAGIRTLETGSNPIGPEHIGLAVQEAFSVADLDPRVRQDMFHLGGQDFSKHIEQLYQQIDAQLLKLGVLPDLVIEFRQEQSKSTSAPRPSPLHHHPSSGGGGGWGPGSASGAGGGAAGGVQAQGHNGAPVSGGGGSWEQQFAKRWQQRGGAELDSPQQMMDTLYGLLERNRRQQQHEDEENQEPGTQRKSTERKERGSDTDDASSRSRPRSRPERRQQILSYSEVMSVLSALQSSAEPIADVKNSSPEYSLAQQIKNHVLSQTARLGKDPRQVQLDMREENAIDLVGMLFDIMLDGERIDDDSRELIARLTVPLTKVALLDRHMFVHKNHPARKLLNRLVQACEGRVGDTLTDRMLLGKVEKTVDRIVAEFNENMAIFQASEEELAQYMVIHQRRIELAEKRAREAQAGREKLELARTRAVTELARRLTGESLPAAFETFLHQPWCHHVSLLLLREGEHSPAVTRALKLADALIGEINLAKQRPGARYWLKSLEPDVRKVLGSIGLFDSAASEVIIVLRDSLRALAENRPELERPLPELPRVGLGKEADHEVETVETNQTPEPATGPSKEAEVFRKMAVGTRLDFIDREGKTEVGKLSWISPVSSRLLFVNPRGRRLCVVTPEELVAMQHMGRMRIHDENGAFDNLDFEPVPAGVTA